MIPFDRPPRGTCARSIPEAIGQVCARHLNEGTTIDPYSHLPVDAWWVRVGAELLAACNQYAARFEPTSLVSVESIQCGLRVAVQDYAYQWRYFALLYNPVAHALTLSVDPWFETDAAWCEMWRALYAPTVPE